MAVRHHAFGFDATTYLDTVARAVGPGPCLQLDGLATEAQRVVAAAGAETKAVLEYLRFEDDWLVDGPDFSAPRLLVVTLVGHLEALPSLSGQEPHGWVVFDRISPIAAWTRADADRLVRGAPLSSLPESLGRPDLKPLFEDAREPGGVLAAPVVKLIASALATVEDRFRNPSRDDAAALAGWPPVATPEGLALTMSRAFDAASAMLRAAQGRSIFLLFE